MSEAGQNAICQTIKVNENFRIGADSHNIIVFLRRDGKKSWRAVAYFTDLWEAAKFIMDCHIKWKLVRLVSEDFLPAISELTTEVEKVHTDLLPLKAIRPCTIVQEGTISEAAE